MTDILAALGVEQLKRIDTILEKVSIASFYSEEIGKIDEFEHLMSHLCWET